MKIEIDTKHDTKEELRHLATMLHALAGSQASSIVADSRFPDPRDGRIQRKLARKGIFDDPAAEPSPASGGLFGMFDDGAEPAHSAVPSQQVSGDLFSIFDSEPAQSSSKSPEVPSVSSLLGETVESSPALLDPYGAKVQQESEEGRSAQDLLDDDRIVPY